MNEDTFPQQLADAMATAFGRQNPVMPEQYRVVLQYRLIRNGLGNYGGHGDAGNDVALLSLTQTRSYKQRSLTFTDDLSRFARKIAVYVDRPPRPAITVPATPPNRFYSVGDIGPITLVEVLGDQDAPIAAGIPVETPVALQAVTPDSKSGKVYRLGFDPPLPLDADSLFIHGWRASAPITIERQIDPDNRDFVEIDRVDRIEHVHILDRTGRPIAVWAPEHD